MRWIRLSFRIFVFIAMAPFAAHARLNASIAKTQTWLLEQTDSQTGLVLSFKMQDDDPSQGVAWTYNQAQALQTHLALGDLANAESLAKAMLNLPKTGGVWYNAYFVKTGGVASRISEQSQSWPGPNLALAHAFLNLLKASSDAALSQRLIEALADLTNSFNQRYVDRGDFAYLVGGKSENEVRTEYAQRAFGFYLAFANYLESPAGASARLTLAKRVEVDDLRKRGEKIVAWVQNFAWQTDHYRPGCPDKNCESWIVEPAVALKKTDPKFYDQFALIYQQYLGVIMADVAGLDPKAFAGGLDWALIRLSLFQYEGRAYQGVARYVGTPSLWGKGTGELAVALRLVDRNADAQRLLKTLQALQNEQGGVLAAVGEPGSGWPLDFRFESVEALNPFVIALGGYDADFIP